MAMTADGMRQYGVTPPISSTLPTDAELRLNETLLNELLAQNNFEATEDTEKRRRVLAKMQKATEDFVRHVGRLKGLNPSVLDSAGGKVSTFGSYRLGVYGPGSDIDTLVVAPKHVNRDDFFAHFPPILEKISDQGAIEEMTCVSDAHVPIIKLEYSGISIDLIFTTLAVSSVPETLDLKDKTLLRGLSETDLRSINGTRVTDEILSLVPQVKSFRLALRAVKLWAQRRAIYANILGFPGGVAWAMLVARICQLYPLACGATIVSKFFHLMLNWPWPRPVLLKQIEDGPLQVRVWNPSIYPGDRRHLMPIITPAYPSMCATHNITHSTKSIILRELQRADQIAAAIVAGKQTWIDLFAKHTFFIEGYKYYLSIVSASRTKEGQQLWSGLVQSKVRRLVSGIEMSDTGVKLAHPFNKGFERVHRCQTEEEIDMIFQGDLRFQVSEEHLVSADTNGIPADTTGGGATEMNGKTGAMTIWTTTFYVGLELATELGKKLDITNPVADFKRQCQEWPQFDPSVNSLRTVHTRNYDLPLDVFEEGEKRPEKTKSRRAKDSKSLSTKASKSTIDSNTSVSSLTPESRKRKTAGTPALEAADVSTSSKKRNLSSGDLTNGTKRGLEAEVRAPSDANI